MLYCAKCRAVCEDSRARCPNCRSARLRAADSEDMTLLHRADQYTAQQLCERFDKAGIRWEAKPFSGRGAASLYDSEVMPTDKNLYVRYGDLPAAQEISAKLKQELDRETEPEEQFEEMPRRKRLAVQTLSILAFLVLVMLAVFGADALANWLKGLFGM